MASLSWNDLSEIVVGKAWRGELSWTAITPGHLAMPYKALVEKARKTRKALSEEEVIRTIGLPAFSAIQMAGQSNLPNSWPTMLEHASLNAKLADQMEKQLRKLRAGDDSGLSEIFRLLENKDRIAEIELVPLSSVVVPKNYTPFTPSGYEPIDRYIGGWPDSGLTIISAPPGTGKTFLALKAMAAYAGLGKQSAFFSIEQTSIQIANRARSVMRLPKGLQHLIHITDETVSVDDIVRVVSGLSGYDMVVIDFAELLLDEEDASESTMSYIYRSLAKLARKKSIVIILLAQLNRANYQTMSLGGIRYSGAAEQMASLVLFLSNPSRAYTGLGTPASDALPIGPNSAAIITGKSREQMKVNGPVAIEVPWTDRGWGDKAVTAHRLGG